MKNKCHCYHTQKKTRYTYNQYTGSPIPHDVEVGVCWGTKECDECNCGGNETKCDFYPEVRKKAKKESVRVGEDYLIITYDCCHPDVPTLCIAREEGSKVRVLNTIQGDAAFGMYHYLTGGAEFKERQGKWKLNKDGSGTCDQCNRTQKNVWDYDNYQNYCGHCGAKMSI